ncbi:MAG: alpha/beta hydrolase [Candidatus Binataceae bacterium]
MRLRYHCGRLTESLVLGLVAITILATRPAAAGGFAQSATPRMLTTTPAVTETAWLSVRGQSPFDRIGLHRLSAVSKPAGPVLLYLPGTNMNSELPLQDPNHWLPLYLAVNGVDVWALDYRTHFIPADTPQDRLSELSRWTDTLFESDIDAAVNFIRASTGSQRLSIAGFSRGATFAYLYAAEHPDRVSGLVILDGFVLTPPSYKEMAGKRPASGVYATDIGGRSLTYEKRQALLKLVIKDPDGPAPIPKFPTARANLEHVVYDSHGFGGRGGLANPIDGYSDAVTLASVLITYDRYWPAVQDNESPLTPALEKSLAESKIPVLAFSSGNMGRRWSEAVKASASSTGVAPEFAILYGWGHLDVLCGTHAKKQVYAPTLAWLKQHAATAAPGPADGPSAAQSAPARPPTPIPRSTGQ